MIAGLRERIDVRHAGLREMLDREQQLRNEPVAVARESIDTRLEAMNELRAQITAERGTYVTRDYLDARLAKIEGLIEPRRRAEPDLHIKLLVLAGIAMIGGPVVVAAVNWFFASE